MGFKSKFILYLLIVFGALSSCSKDNLNDFFESAIIKPNISQTEHFTITDKGENILISWHTYLYDDIKVSYVIQIMQTNYEFVLRKEVGELTLKRSMDLYGKKVMLSVITNDGRSIKIDSMVYNNNYNKFFTCRNKFIAHRGLSSLYPENTMIAFEKAIEVGFEYLECDIWLTKDNQWVVIHDETINRTSDGSGKVSEYTLEELKRYNFGFPRRFGNKYPQKILSINEFVEVCKSKNVKPLIELKQGARDQDYMNLLKLLNSIFIYEEYALHSFSPSVLYSIRRIDKEVILGLISTTAINSNFVDVNNLYPCFYNLHLSQINLEQPFNQQSNSGAFNLYLNGAFITFWNVGNAGQIAYLSQNNLFSITPFYPTFLK